MEGSADQTAFSKWRLRLWPVRGQELGKLLPLLLMKFCASFNYTVLHATKDTLVVTTKGSGAEAIPILKGWVVLIAAFLAMITYTKLSNILTKPKLFYTVMTPFLLFFGLFGFWLYPNREWLSANDGAAWLISILGESHSHWVAVYRYWINSLFFVMAELWGGIVIALLFWGFANQICSFKEAKRFYTLFAVGGHIGVILAGPIILYFSRGAFGNDYEITVRWLMLIVVFICALMMATYWHLNRRSTLEGNPEEVERQERERAPNKLSLFESLRYIARSPYLGWIALMVIGYGMAVNLVEVSWKATLKLQYPNPNDYSAFTGTVHTIIGLVSLFLALLVGGNLIRKWGWEAGAMSTPIVLGVTSIAFFGLYMARDSAWVHEFNFPILTAIVLCGACHNIACKSMKYCLFDPTKEMAYIPLDPESKIKGKAAVDVVASRFGKSGSSWIQAFMIDVVGTGSILGVVNLMFPFVVVVVAVWMVAVRALSRLYDPVEEPVLSSAA